MQPISPGVYNNGVFEISKYTENVPGVSALFVIVSDKGEDNKLHFISSIEKFYETFGLVPNYQRYGKYIQGYMNAEAYIKNGGSCFVMNIRSENATFAHAYVDLYDLTVEKSIGGFNRIYTSDDYLDEDMVSKNLNLINDASIKGYRMIEGATNSKYVLFFNDEKMIVIDEDPSTKTSEQIRRLYITSAIDSPLKYDELALGLTLSHDAKTYTLDSVLTLTAPNIVLRKPVLLFRKKERGSLNNYMIKSTQDIKDESINTIDIYQKMGNNKNVIIESFKVSYDPNLKDESGESLFVGDILNKYSKVITAEYNYTVSDVEIIDEIRKNILTYTDENNISHSRIIDVNGIIRNIDAMDIQYDSDNDIYESTNNASTPVVYLTDDFVKEEEIKYLHRYMLKQTYTSMTDSQINALLFSDYKGVTITYENITETKDFIEPATKTGSDDLYNIIAVNEGVKKIIDGSFKLKFKQLSFNETVELQTSSVYPLFGTPDYEYEAGLYTCSDSGLLRKFDPKGYIMQYIGLIDVVGGNDGDLISHITNRVDITELTKLLIKAFNGELDLNSQSEFRVTDTLSTYFNLVFDANYPTPVKNAIYNLCHVTRQDCIAILDLGQTKDTDDSLLKRRNDVSYNSKYAIIYENMSYIYYDKLNQDIWVPTSYHVAKMLPRIHRNGFIWAIPAGYTNSVLEGIKKLKYVPRASNIIPNDFDKLYMNQINPILKDIDGYIINSQLTSMRTKSAYQDFSTVMLLIYIQRAIRTYTKKSIFVRNNQKTWDDVNSKLSSFLSQIRDKEGIEGFKVDVGATEYELLNKTFHIHVEFKPIKTAEKIVYDITANTTV